MQVMRNLKYHLLDNLKITAAIRYDGFSYDYDNKDEGASGVEDQKVNLQ